MSKYSNKQKLEVVKGVMKIGMSHQTAGNMIGACKGVVQSMSRKGNCLDNSVI